MSETNASFKMGEFSWASVVLQIVSAVVVLYAVYFIARFIRKGEQIVAIQTEAEKKTSIIVVPGVKNSDDGESMFLTTKVANTLNKRKEFVYLSPSLNSEGGAQFTYSFWLKVEPRSEFDAVLFLRGDKKRASFVNNRQGASETVKHPVAFCPMVKVRMDSNFELSVTAQFNSNSEFNNSVTHVIKNGSPNDTQEYHLVCVSCSDGEYHGLERGVVCRVWFDQIPIEKFFEGEALRENGGNLYVCPKFEEEGDAAYPKTTHAKGKASMRNLSYHNYALTGSDVFDLMYNESNIVNRPYVQVVEPGNSGYMQRALTLQEMHVK